MSDWRHLGRVLGVELRLAEGKTVPVVAVLSEHQQRPELRSDVPHEALPELQYQTRTARRYCYCTVFSAKLSILPSFPV